MSAAIALEDKPHQAVTEAANAVVEKNRIGGIWHGGRGQLRGSDDSVPTAILSPFQGYVT